MDKENKRKIKLDNIMSMILRKLKRNLDTFPVTKFDMVKVLLGDIK